MKTFTQNTARKLLIAALAIGLAGTFATQASAQPTGDDSALTEDGKRHKRGRHKRGRGMRKGGKMMGPIRMLMRESESLGIAEDTKATIKGILKSSRANKKADRQANKANRQALRAALAADVVDEAVVMQLVADISTAKAAAFQDQIATTLQVRSLVTAEQWQGAEALMKQKRSERRAKRGKRGKGGKWGKRGNRGNRAAPLAE